MGDSMKKIVCIAVMMLLAACASVQSIAPVQVHRESKHVFDKSYKLGEKTLL